MYSYGHVHAIPEETKWTGKKGGNSRKKIQRPDKSMMPKKSKKLLFFVPNFEKDDPRTHVYVSL